MCTQLKAYKVVGGCPTINIEFMGWLQHTLYCTVLYILLVLCVVLYSHFLVNYVTVMYNYNYWYSLQLTDFR